MGGAFACGLCLIKGFHHKMIVNKCVASGFDIFGVVMLNVCFLHFQSQLVTCGGFASSIAFTWARGSLSMEPQCASYLNATGSRNLLLLKVIFYFLRPFLVGKYL